jgi:hypothetical protein
MNSMMRAIVVFALFLLPASVGAQPLVYVVTASQQFGVVDLKTGAFQPIGDPAPEPLTSLVWGPDGSLLTLFGASGSLARINPSTGATAIVGPTGLGSNAFSLAEVKGKLYLTDFSNNIYSVDSGTGAATLIRATGMPADPTTPFTFNEDGTFNLCDQTFYGVDGVLYATFDAFAFNPTPGPNFLAVKTKVAPKLYRIDPSSGVATLVGRTDVQLAASVDVDDRFYAFRGVLTGFAGFPQAYSELLTLDLATGGIGFLRTIDPAAGPIFGAAPVRKLR